jgi:Tol biopolymer transport system component/DNA-binding winged helix-turn-helix (wHTH) protein
VFEADIQAEELRKKGVRIKLPGQSFQILRLLLERSGELVTREELRQALWPGNTYVDFDHGLNAAVTRLRDALGDSADSPRFIETLPRRGYRFIAPLLPEKPAFVPHVLSFERAKEQEVVGSRSLRKWWIGGALGLAIALLTSLAIYRLTHSTQPNTPTVTPFTSLPGREVNPSFSPDGAKIVFAWDGDPPAGQRGFDLYVKQIGSEHLQRLTNTASGWLVPTWSPDGESVYFTRASAAGNGIYMISALGGDERIIKKDGSHFEGVSVSADGKYMAYPEMTNTGLSRITVVDLHSMANVPVLLPKCLNSEAPAFAPVGLRLAFTCTPSWGIADVYVLPDLATAPRHVARVFGSPTGMGWAKHGRELILGVERGQSDLWRIDVDSGKAESLLVGAQATEPTVARSGERMAFAQTSGSANIWRVDLDRPEHSAQRLIPSTRLEQNPTYSPDGKHILFESLRSGFSEIWMSRGDGSEVQQLTRFEGPLTGTPRWAPDSHRFAFDSRAEGKANVYVMDINERVARRVQTDVPDNSTPGWSHDGQWLYFRSDGAHEPGIYKVSPQGGKAVLVAAGAGYDPAESASGQDLFYTAGYKQMVVHRLSLKSGADSVLPGISAAGHMLAWTLTGRGIYFLQESGQDALLNFYDLKNDRVRKMLDLPRGEKTLDMMGGLSVSPDERFAVYSRAGEQQSDIMLVDNFH